MRRLVPRTIDNYGKPLRYLTDYLAEECQLEKLEDIKLAHTKKFLLMKEEQGCKPHYILAEKYRKSMVCVEKTKLFLYNGNEFYKRSA